MPVEPFKARVAQLALAAAHAEGFALAGGNALAAHELLSRPTQDVDLFSPRPGGTGRVLEAVVTALVTDGYTVEVIRGSAEAGADFAQLHIGRDGETTQLDLGRDWRAHEAINLDVGPVLHLDDAVGSKIAALLGRGLARDFMAAQRLDDLPDVQFMRYELNREQIAELRARFADWPRDSDADDVAQQAHAFSHQL